jgi:hypothetical protein
MQVAIYARVSTEDKVQDPENQLRELRTWCANSDHEIVREYVDHVSGPRASPYASSSLRCSRTPAAASSTACCSGPSTASAARAWCQPSTTSRG